MNFTQELLNKEIIFLKPNDPFTWASGIKSPIYCDNRLTLGYPDMRTYIAEQMVTMIKEYYPECEVVMGTSTAGIPHAALVADKLGLPGGYVRGGAKKHGRNQQIEGAKVQGKKVVVVEDLISTGGSSVEVIDILQEANADVLGVVAIFSYKMAKANEAFAKRNTSFHLITDIDQLLVEATKINYLNEEEAMEVRTFLKAPSEWRK